MFLYFEIFPPIPQLIPTLHPFKKATMLTITSHQDTSFCFDCQSDCTRFTFVNLHLKKLLIVLI